MRASIILIVAVLLAALFIFDAYEYDGHYRKTAIEQIDHEAENLLGK
jgi:hypothetical protein